MCTVDTFTSMIFIGILFYESFSASKHKKKTHSCFLSISLQCEISFLIWQRFSLYHLYSLFKAGVVSRCNNLTPATSAIPPEQIKTSTSGFAAPPLTAPLLPSHSAPLPTRLLEVETGRDVVFHHSNHAVVGVMCVKEILHMYMLYICCIYTDR